MDIDSLLSMITPAVVGSILIAIIKIIYDRYKTIEREKQVTSASDRLNTTRQIEMILSANESLRKELRIDVERLRKEMDTMSQASKTEIEELKLSYEKEIEALQLQITKMNSELVLYREEHRQMRQLLSKEGIVFNSAISTKKGD